MFHFLTLSFETFEHLLLVKDIRRLGFLWLDKLEYRFNIEIEFSQSILFAVVQAFGAILAHEITLLDKLFHFFIVTGPILRDHVLVNELLFLRNHIPVFLQCGEHFEVLFARHLGALFRKLFGDKELNCAAHPRW